MSMFLHAQMSAGVQAGQLAQNPELLAQMMQVSGVVVWGDGGGVRVVTVIWIGWVLKEGG